MSKSENRNYIRLDSLHLLDYLIVDREGRQTTYSMGRTLDVSEHGMKLEVSHTVNFGDTLLITVGIENDLVDLTGEVIHCKKNNDLYTLGIEFSDISDKGMEILKKYISAFKKHSAGLAR
jgi:c-di-GMP-binding flagellar brake protein YcgR